ncbi:MAG: DUF397 domain-containing protein [Acidimicrobiales bacterium]
MANDPNTGLKWRKSSFSGSNGGDCVEIAEAGVGLLVRNSKARDAGTISFTRSELAAFVDGCKAGEFDDLCL